MVNGERAEEVGPQVDRPAAREDLAAASPEVILSVHALFEEVQGWRQLPQVAADLARAIARKQD